MSASSDPVSAVPALNSCWRRIGVWGDRSCPELVAHTHCGNCPVFSEAGRSLLDRAAPDEYLAEWAEVLRKPPNAHEETIAALLFRIGPQWLALPTAVVISVTEQRPVHRLPHRAIGVFTGLVNVAGELQLAFDLRALLELPVHAALHLSLSCQVYPRHILCRRDGQAFAFIADEVYGTAELATAQMQPAVASGALAIFAKGKFLYRRRPILLLDDELLTQGIARLSLA